MMIISKRTGLLISIFFGLAVLAVVYPRVLFSPNQYMFNQVGDGNYFIYAWHIKHDTSFDHFEGMSYPYGESLTMDSLHVYSSFMKILTAVFPSSANYAVGFLNLMILLSIVAGAVFLYLLLVRFKVAPLVSAIAANGIAFLSSQAWLLAPAGHYGLIFICFFPMAWYFLLRYYDKPGIWISLVIGLNTLFWTYSHVYLGFTIILFILVSHLVFLIADKKLPQRPAPFSLSAFFQVGIPFLVFLLFHFSGGEHPHRIDMPFMTHHSNTFSSVFFPVDSPFNALYSWTEKIDFARNKWNGIGVYTGLAANILLLAFILRFIWAVFKNELSKISKLFEKKMGLSLASAIVLLLLSMAIPLKFFPEEFVNKLPLVNQFSSFGRLGWAFYYVINVFVLAFIYSFLRGRKQVLLSLVFIALILVEGIYIHKKQSEQISANKNLYLEKNLDKDKEILSRINAEEFQAILPLPYYFFYTAAVKAKGTDNSILNSQLASWYSGLPILSTFLSRPSVSETMSIYRQLLPFPYQVPLEELVNDGRDILVVSGNVDTANLNINERLLLGRSRLIKENSGLSLYRLSVENLLSNDNAERQEAFGQIEESLYPKGELLLSDSSYFFIYNDFEQLASDKTYKGKGALQGIKEEMNILCDTPTAVFDTSLNYLLSLWYYNHLWDQTFNTVVVVETDSLGNELHTDYFSPFDGELIDGWWYLFEKGIKIRSNGGRLRVFVQGFRMYSSDIWVDELMIRPENLDIYKWRETEGSRTLSRNNIKYIINREQDEYK